MGRKGASRVIVENKLLRLFIMLIALVHYVAAVRYGVVVYLQI